MLGSRFAFELFQTANSTHGLAIALFVSEIHSVVRPFISRYCPIWLI